MMTKKYDLHVHSTCSDGSSTPEELLHLAKESGLSGISITDHDTVEAYTPKIYDLAKKLGLELIPGIELSTHLKDENVHVLGYMIDPNAVGLREFCEKHKERRRVRNGLILELLKKHKMPISIDELYQFPMGTIGRPHIAYLMVQKGYVSSIPDAFNHWIGDDKPCYASGMRFPLDETIRVIHQAGGKAVVAHPILIKRKNLIKELASFPFDGWECFYAKFSIEQNNTMVEIAKKHHFIMTGGSDFHGTVKPHTALGSTYTDEDNLARLKSNSR